MRLIKIIFRVALWGAVGVVGLVVCLLGLMWVDHSRETMLPAPTGSFAVGRATFDWRDPTRVDPMAPEAGTKRELAAWIWYPAERNSTAQTVDYLPAAWRKAMDGGWFITLMNRDPSRVRAHSFQDAALSGEQKQYPVVLMRPGLAALTTNYTSLVEDLASHGYVVVGFDAPYRSIVTVFPDGRVLKRAAQNNADLVGGEEQKELANALMQDWVADTGFALDKVEELNASDPAGRFTGRLDMQRVGMFGHSLGGATTLQFCHVDARCKAGIDLDGLPLGSVVADGVGKPFMFLMSDHSGEAGVEKRQVMGDIQSIYERLPADGREMITIRGANHFGFSDDTKNHVAMGVMQTLGRMMDGQRQIAITEHYIDVFFDVYLRGAPGAELRSGTGYAEVEYAR
jgi:predicted dienelactone hydrolase